MASPHYFTGSLNRIGLCSCQELAFPRAGGFTTIDPARILSHSPAKFIFHSF